MKTLRMPTNTDFRTMREVPQTLVGYTDDGHVGFTAAGIDLVCKVEISAADGERFSRELLRACFHARKADEEARGLNEWVSRPLEGGLYEISHRGEVAAFRPIVNGKRRTKSPSVPLGALLSKRVVKRAPPLNGGQRCTACRCISGEGATMFVAVKKGEPGYIKGQAINWGFGGVRRCQRCVQPELVGAIVLAGHVELPEKEQQ